ncbi:hypothetical protein QLX67_10865, partial [Balneolaceae bacterium ANBcel3]|nr:hypothetical protein [Balneolaceae bacterium ANBcel3]
MEHIGDFIAMDERTNNRGVGMMKNHLDHLENEIEWFRKVLDTRIKTYFGDGSKAFSVHEVPPPSFSETSAYESFVQKHQLKSEERLVLILALLPHIKPELLDVFFTRNTHFDRGFTEFGGLKGNSYSGFMPTAETAMFILAGGDLKKRVTCLPIFSKDHLFARLSILHLNVHSPSEPALSAQIDISKDYVEYFLTGQPGKPVYSVSFPAQKMETSLKWDDLVLPADTLEPVNEVMVWIRKGELLKNRWGENRHLKKGYRVLFYGPPGTGKTL